MPRIAAVYVTEERLTVSPAPSAEIAAAAMDAQARAGLDRADFVILAVPPGAATASLVDDVTGLAERGIYPEPVT